MRKLIALAAVALALLSSAPASALPPPGWDDCSYESTRCVDIAD